MCYWILPPLLSISNPWGVKWAFVSWSNTLDLNTPVYWKWKRGISSCEVTRKSQCHWFYQLLMVRVEERDTSTNYKDKGEISTLVPKVFSSHPSSACSTKHLSMLFAEKWPTESSALIHRTSQWSQRVTLMEKDVLWLVIKKSTSIHTFLQAPSQWVFRRLNMKFTKIGSSLLPSALLVCWIYKKFLYILTALQTCIWWQRQHLGTGLADS